MKIKQLNQTDPDHEGELLRDYEALYRGGKYFRARIDRFLHQNPQEPLKVYEARKREAVYRSYIGTIVDYFTALLFASPLIYKAKLNDDEVDQPEWFDAFTDDCDGGDTDIVEFLRLRTVDAMVKRRGFWMLDYPESYGTAQSKADAERDGSAAVTLRRVEAECVLDCARDRKGRLLWAIVHDVECPRETPDDARDEDLHTWHVLDRERVRVFQVRVEKGRQPDGEKDAQLVRELTHGLGEVPLIELDVGDGLWTANRLESPQLEHFRLSSANNWSIRRTCYAMPVFKLADPEEFATRQMGAGYYITLSSANDEDATWIAPPVAHLAETREEIRAQKDEIFRLVTQMSLGVENNAAAVGRSAESKVVDAEAIQVVLRSYGGLVRDALKKTLNLLSKARGEEHVWTIEGLDKFDTIPADVLIELLTQAMDLDIPSETFNKEALVRAAYGLLPGIDQDTKDTIRYEIDNGIQQRASELKLWKEQNDQGTVPGGPPKPPAGSNRGRSPDGQDNAVPLGP